MQTEFIFVLFACIFTTGFIVGAFVIDQVEKKRERAPKALGIQWTEFEEFIKNPVITVRHKGAKPKTREVLRGVHAVIPSKKTEAGKLHKPNGAFY
jgi:hypothetical protein